MRARTLLLCAAAIAAVALPTPAGASHGAVRIVELLPDPGQGREFIELRNVGSGAVELSGWQVVDAASNTFVFPQWRLEPGQRVVVWGGGQADGAGPVWNKSTVWNNGGDVAALHDPSGALVDRLAYGSHGTTAPVGHEAQAPAPGPGVALVWDGKAWTHGTPTPGQAPGALQGQATLDVQNVPPRIDVSGLPAWAAPSSQVTLPLLVEDDNGPADIASWQVASGAQTLASGNGTPGSVVLQAPAAVAPWSLAFTATDQAGATANASHTIDVRVSPLAIVMPADGGLRFPALAPGARDIPTIGAFTLRNDGSQPVDAVFDISPLAGPGTIEVAGNLVLLWDDGVSVQQVPFDAPMLTLPTLPAGGAVQVTLRLIEVPVPLAAGTYGTTFSVVA